MSPRHEAERFRQRMEQLRQDPDDPMVLNELMMAVGFLMGGGLPGCAAALAHLTRQKFPDAERFMWEERGP